jgi:predicted 2-oxoglutarate/Fe(II)-dependent dioxygenase YbiX
MFNTTLKDYVKIYKGFYDPELCTSITNNLKNINWDLHTFYNGITGERKSYENELSVSSDVIPEKQKLDEQIWHVINQYVTKDMSYMKDWFSGWSGYTASRFNKYEPDTRMKIHADLIYSMFDGTRKGVPILSVLGLLNSNYEGGEFIMCGEEIKLDAGDVIVFPSNFLYPHEVKLVTSGVRYSFVSWVW